MGRYRIAVALFGVLLLAASAAGQSSDVPVAQQLSGKKKSPPKQNAPCPPPEEPQLFDVHKYLPLGNGVHGPRALSTPDPEYSEAARKAKLNGLVAMAVAVNEEGGIDDVKIVCSSDPSFEQSSLNAIRQWKFAPATKDGTAVAVQMNVTTEFTLN